MNESRQLPSGAGAGAGAALRKLVPPPALCGFLLLLALTFTVSYAVGAAAGPVAPGLHGTGTSRGTGDTGGGGGTDDMGDMHGGGH
ncbi:hypothetical protein [Streptomyces anandii]|uniref:hypothetical protein n=1 Tax=Streptomyces anandii TaxID=285454 RepID=UPI00167A8DAF|nr:hypothetical protein [Streptomyces anandii]GGY12003.1 hypothetical protein GCM10010510_67530 [Streptomyces anandii JCM 4720]